MNIPQVVSKSEVNMKGANLLPYLAFFFFFDPSSLPGEDIDPNTYC